MGMQDKMKLQAACSRLEESFEEAPDLGGMGEAMKEHLTKLVEILKLDLTHLVSQDGVALTEDIICEDIHRIVDCYTSCVEGATNEEELVNQFIDILNDSESNQYSSLKEGDVPDWHRQLGEIINRFDGTAVHNALDTASERQQSPGPGSAQ